MDNYNSKKTKNEVGLDEICKEATKEGYDEKRAKIVARYFQKAQKIFQDDTFETDYAHCLMNTNVECLVKALKEDINVMKSLNTGFIAGMACLMKAMLEDGFTLKRLNEAETKEKERYGGTE